MKKIVLLFAFFASLLVMGCGEEKAFMTPSEDVIVIDITHKDIIFNGKKIGDLIKDIENATNKFNIRPLDSKLRNMNPKPRNVHIHMNNFASYKALYCTFLAAQILGYENIEIVLGDNFKHPISPYLFRQKKDNRNPCNGPRGIMREFFREKLESKMTAEEKYEKRLKELETDRECAENYMELTFLLDKKENSVSFSISVSDIGLIDKKSHENFSDIEKAWDYIKEIHFRETLQNKVDKDEISFIAKEKLKIADISEYLIHLSQMGYKIKFGYFN